MLTWPIFCEAWSPIFNIHFLTDSISVKIVLVSLWPLTNTLSEVYDCCYLDKYVYHWSRCWIKNLHFVRHGSINGKFHRICFLSKWCFFLNPLSGKKNIDIYLSFVKGNYVNRQFMSLCRLYGYLKNTLYFVRHTPVMYIFEVLVIFLLLLLINVLQCT